MHIPYCARKCPYCDFNVHVERHVPEEEYADALAREIRKAAGAAEWSGRRAASVFFGGGTPSLFSAHTLGSLLATADRHFGLADRAEITLEANPEDLAGASAASLVELRAAGIDRLSIGAQSFAPRHLSTLGRRHTPQDVRRGVARAREAGFANVSCDLIFAVPGQSVADWAGDLRDAIALAPEHVSTYGMTYEHGTPMTAARDARRIEPVAEESERTMYEIAIDALTGAGYHHYEISNFAREGFESRHNLAYWTWSDYLGVGAGAHGFARCTPAHGRVWGRRYANEKLPADYMRRAPDAVAASEELSRETAMSEYVLVGLRRTAGIEERVFRVLFGAALDESAPALASLVGAGLLARTDGHVRLTREGLLLADSVCARLADIDASGLSSL